MSVFLILFLLFTITDLLQPIKATYLGRDKQVLLELKSFLQIKNTVNQGYYAKWNDTGADPSPCKWHGITCEGGRVTRIDLSSSSISGDLFANFSALASLTHLDLSQNTIGGSIPADLNRCSNLKYLNLSHNLIGGDLHLAGLTRLEVLDLTLNRFTGGVRSNFPGICANLVTLNISMNNFTGDITAAFDDCPKLKYLDISTNKFTGGIWSSISGLKELTASENNLSGRIQNDTFRRGCVLELLDLSQNDFSGQLPDTIANCKNLSFLNVLGNDLEGKVPSTIGSLPQLEALLLGSNKFDRDLPLELLGCNKLKFLDVSRNGFRGDVQPIFGRIKPVRFLVLHGNSYTGGIDNSGVLKLPRLARLDLSNNSFSGKLPVGVVCLSNLKFLILAYNNFSGQIPSEFGAMTALQALDLSYNKLSGPIPPSIGNLTSLLWLMLADNSLTGTIPSEIGNCRSLLWLNLANNRLIGRIPPSVSEIGRDSNPTFELNRRDEWVTAGSDECFSMKRWIPTNYPPFSFAYTIMNQKSCRSTWDNILKGIGIFPICIKSPTLAISGYLQLAGNRLSGAIPPEIGRMGNFSLINLNQNNLSGSVPPEIGDLPLVVLNVSSNDLSGSLPSEIGDIRCLQNLDLSYNNFSGELPERFNRLTELDNFNASYNRFLSGVLPVSGQMATFDNNSFIGDPLIVLSSAANGNNSTNKAADRVKYKWSPGKGQFFLFLGIALGFAAAGILLLFGCMGVRSPETHMEDLILSEDGSRPVHGIVRSWFSTSPSTTELSLASSDAVRVFCLDKTSFFTYEDIVTATRNFADEMVVGRGGFGTVYKGVLPNGRRLAVKKLLREGPEGEREFRAEMEVLSRVRGAVDGWRHPNLVVLLGWCLFGPVKLLVYEYMDGGSLEDVIMDWINLPWTLRVEVAIGVARALFFFHHQCLPAVVHRDVKASNVLLDGEGKARVTDFGLARVVGPGESHVSTIVAGTVGYVAPEYGHTWQATTKGDVYSFGILVMELATGRRAVDGREECLVEWARRVVPTAEEIPEEWVGTEDMWEMLRIGMRCAAETPQERPNMKEVLDMLRGISTVEKEDRSIV